MYCTNNLYYSPQIRFTMQTADVQKINSAISSEHPGVLVINPEIRRGKKMIQEAILQSSIQITNPYKVRWKEKKNIH